MSKSIIYSMPMQNGRRVHSRKYPNVILLSDIPFSKIKCSNEIEFSGGDTNRHYEEWIVEGRERVDDTSGGSHRTQRGMGWSV